MNIEGIMGYENNIKCRPHLVILGAGTSITAILNDMKTSVMYGFIDKLGMGYIIESINLQTV